MGLEEREAALEMLRQPEPEPAQTETEPASHEPAEPAKTETAADPAAPAGDAAVPAAQPGAETAAEQPASGDTWARAFDALKDDLDGRCGSAEQMKAQLADAHALYDICSGKAEPAVLLDLVKEMYPDAFKKIEAYFGKDGQARGPEPAAPAQPADELRKKVTDLEQWKTETERQRQQRELHETRTGHAKRFVERIEQLAKKAELDAEETAEFTDAISAAIGRDAAMLKRFESGDLRDVERLFNERHAKLNERFKKRADAMIAGKQRRDRTIPKSPAGGSPPAPATAPRPNLGSRDERIAAATEAWRQAQS